MAADKRSPSPGTQMWLRARKAARGVRDEPGKSQRPTVGDILQAASLDNDTQKQPDIGTLLV